MFAVLGRVVSLVDEVVVVVVLPLVLVVGFLAETTVKAKVLMVQRFAAI